MEQVHGYPSQLRVMGKRALEWDLNDWNWDGDLFIATPSTQFIPLSVPGNSSNSSSSCSESANDDGRKRRVIHLDDCSEEPASLTLKLGANSYPVPITVPHAHAQFERETGKKTPGSHGGSSNRAVCQVQDCGADLTKAKDYHRRHKVCEMHSKATKAVVANVLQRFCQQCSRFHVLQEFDEGKRSCRRRLAGHNKRRRKTQPETPVHGNPVNEDQTNSVLLMSLLRILTNLHANNRSDQATDQDLAAQLLKSLANPSGLQKGKDISGILYESQKLVNGGMPNDSDHSAKMSAFISDNHRIPPRATDQHVSLPDVEIQGQEFYATNSRSSEVQIMSLQERESLFPMKASPPAYTESTARVKMNNFDLNDAYVDSDDGTEDLERSPVNENYATGSVNFPLWTQQNSQQSSPQQTSGNSDSASAQSPSSSSGEAQSRTDRIVFKLFGKEPSDFPLVLRGQILDWLAHSPTEIESYIRPGCIVLTIYLRLAESLWEELCCDLSSCLTRLFDVSDGEFWRTGWIYVRVQNQIAFVYNGQVVLDTSLDAEDSACGKILSVMPIAVPMHEQARFEIRGLNLSSSTTRLLCAIEGKYLDQDATEEAKEDGETLEEDETEQSIVSCSIPNVTGRGYIEVEDFGISSSFFPFIVAEKDVCSDIRTLESILKVKRTDDDAFEDDKIVKSWHHAMDFINEMGWLLHRSHLKSRLADLDPNTVLFSFRRYKWLMDFSMDHDWCAVVKKLLDIMVAGNVGSGEHPSLKVALSEMGLLHRAVRRNSRSMVELLLRYVPVSSSEEFMHSDGKEKFLFRPDAHGPGGLTPLHIAAGRDGSEDILDALVDDPGKIGIDAWKNARDSTGATPEDYARLRGHYAYMHIVQRKIPRSSTSGHVVVDIPGESSHGGAVSFEVGRSASFTLNQSCKVCDQKKMLAYYGRSARTSLVYRPAMLSMVAIAAVCVCVALLFKSMPSVVCVFQPFRWEMLNYGSS